MHLVDGHARSVTYLRLSLTDRCNYRCQYCMPAAGVALSPKAEQLSAEEIVRLVRALQPLGLRRVRLTGGEPTIRRDLIDIVSGLAALGLEDLAMTTNGELLAELALPLRQAGLHRLNISLDSLNEARFLAITRRGRLDRVLAGIEAASSAGFAASKLNTVVLGGHNEDELPALCEFAWHRQMIPRFIEEMPMSDGALFMRGRFVAAKAMRQGIAAAFGPLQVDSGASVVGAGPARYWKTAAGERVGLISAVTEPFCETCNRVRVTATGRLHACLSSDDEVNLLDDLRGGTEAGLLEHVRGALRRKAIGHQFSTCGTGAPKKHMVTIGG